MEEGICFDGLCKEQLEDSPEIYIISYTSAPGKTTNSTVKDLNTKMYKYVFDGKIKGEMCSEHSLEKLICKENIKDFANKELKKFLIEDEGNKHTSTLKISNRDYGFNFIFVDTQEELSWNCLGKIK